jgi:hypothetical protein
MVVSDVDEHRLAVRACAVQEEQRVLAGYARQAVADHQLQVGHQLGVAACDVGQERAPRRTVALRCGRGHLGHPVIASVRSHAARAQIDHAAWGVERPDVGIPLLGGGRVLGSERAIFSTDEIVAELASLPLSRGCPL